MISGLDLLFLEVNNLEESVAFYSDVLAFRIDSHEPNAEPPIASLRSGSLRITLVQQLETMLKRGSGVHVVLGVADVDAFYESVCARDDYVALKISDGVGGEDVVFVLLHAIESVLPQRS